MDLLKIFFLDTVFGASISGGEPQQQQNQGCFVCCEANLTSSKCSSVFRSITPHSSKYPRTSVPCHYLKSEFKHSEGQLLDNSSHFLQRFASLFNKPHLSDVTLVVGDVRFFAHKFILSALSDVFHVMLLDHSWSDHDKSSVTLLEEDMCAPVFEPFLRYFYTATIHLTHDTVLPLLMLADKYNVSDLQVLCIEYMTSHLVTSVSRNQVVPWLQYAQLADHTLLQEQCRDFICCNFRKVASTRYFFEMDACTLCSFLQSSDLVIHDEFTLFVILSKWIHNQTSLMDSSDCDDDHDVMVEFSSSDALEMLALIRFPMMTVEQLVQLDRETIVKDHRQFFIRSVALAMQLHYNKLTADEKQFLTRNNHLVTARCYTASQWCTDPCFGSGVDQTNVALQLNGVQSCQE